MTPSTTASASTNSAPAARTSGASAGYAAVRRPRSTPAAPSASAAWQSCATGFARSKKCRMIRWQSGSLRMYSGAPAARDHQRCVPRRIDLAEGQVRRPGVARLLRVGVVALDEIVHDQLELLLRRRRDVDLVTLLSQTLVRIEDLERLGGVAGEDQDLCRHDEDLLAASFADSGARAQARPLTRNAPRRTPRQCGSRNRWRS